MNKYKVMEMEDVLFSGNYDLSEILDAYLEKYGTKTPLWCKEFEHSYGIVDGDKAVACFHVKDGSISQITIIKGLVEPVSYLIFDKARQVFDEEEDKEIYELIMETDRLCKEIDKTCKEIDKIVERMKRGLKCIK